MEHPGERNPLDRKAMFSVLNTTYIRKDKQSGPELCFGAPLIFACHFPLPIKNKRNFLQVLNKSAAL